MSAKNFDHVSPWRGNSTLSVPRNGERTRPGSLAQVIHINGPIRRGMTLLTTNEIAELVEFTDDPLAL